MTPTLYSVCYNTLYLCTADTFFTSTTMEVLFPVTVDTAIVTINVFPDELIGTRGPGVIIAVLEATSVSSNVCVIIGSPSQAAVIIPPPM